ncbi:MAG: hypothetical protein GF363_18125 [Chitinivibrionales bacterium]|nr:hypothetical protein [Chitinivibrionales bacterium]
MNKKPFFTFFWILFTIYNYSHTPPYRHQHDLSLPPSPKGLLYLSNGNQKALMICVGQNPSNIKEIFFKSPSGVAIRGRVSDNLLNGSLFEFFYSTGNQIYFFKHLISISHASYGLLLVPLCSNINGKIIAGFYSTEGEQNQENSYNTQVTEDINRLPLRFQEGLRDLLLFGDKSLNGIHIIVTSLHPFFKCIQTYDVEVEPLLNNDREIINRAMDQFSLLIENPARLETNLPSRKPYDTKYIKIDHENAEALYVSYREYDEKEIYFIGQNNLKLKVIIAINNYPGIITEFQFVKGDRIYIIKRLFYHPFYQKHLKVPVTYFINDEYIPGFLTSVSQVNTFTTRLRQKFAVLPEGFKRVIKEFFNHAAYALCSRNLLNTEPFKVFGKELGFQLCNTPFEVHKDPELIKSIQYAFDKSIEK